MSITEIISYLYENFVVHIFEYELIALSLIVTLAVLITMRDLLVTYILVVYGSDTGRNFTTNITK